MLTTAGSLSPVASRKLAQLGWAITTAGLAGLLFLSPVEDYTVLLLGAVTLVLAVWPALRWASEAKTWFPVFELFMLTSVPFYALPILTGSQELTPIPPDVVRTAAAIFVGFQLMAITAFQFTRGKPARSRLWLAPLLPDRALRGAEVGLWLHTAYIYVAHYLEWIPYEWSGTLRAIFTGIGIAATFLVSFRLGARQLSQASTFALVLNLFAQTALLFGTLYLISGTSLLLLALIGYVAASRRFPFVTAALLAGALVVLHHGKSEMRKIYWQDGEHRRPAVTEMPAFYGEWWQFGTQLDRPDAVTGVRQSRLWERASLFQMLCLVVDRVPERAPALNGTSYVDIPALLIPRFLWPDKPSALDSNVRLALHFGLVSEESAGSVSIAFGPVAEAVANFGVIGVLGLGLLTGWAMKRCVVAAADAPQFSGLGLLMILLTAWSFQVEQVAATWLSSLFQAGLVVVGLPLLVRKLLYPEE